MSRLAVVAALLMLVAPLVSRAVQMQPVAVVAVVAEHMAHAMPGMDHAGHMQAMQEDTHEHDTAPTASHAAHGEACDYCVLAMRLLPWLALAVLLAPLLHRPVAFVPRRVELPASLRWPAHSARGPPRFS